MNEIYTILQNFNNVAKPVAEETVTEAVEFDPQDFEYIMEEIKSLTHQALQMLPYEHRRGAEGYWYAHINDAVDGRGMLTMRDSLEEASGGESEEEAWESIENTAQNLLKEFDGSDVDLDVIDKVSSKYNISPGSSQASALAQQEKEFHKTKNVKYDPELGRDVEYDSEGRPDYHELFNISNKDATPEYPKSSDDEVDLDIIDKVAAKYNISPGSDQAAMLAKQEKEFHDEPEAKTTASSKSDDEELEKMKKLVLSLMGRHFKDDEIKKLFK